MLNTSSVVSYGTIQELRHPLYQSSPLFLQHQNHHSTNFVLERPLSSRHTQTPSGFACQVRCQEATLESGAKTTAALNLCKEQIVQPFNKLLIFIAWRPFSHNHMDRPSFYMKLTNVAYFTLLLGIMLFAYVYQYAACQWRLNLRNAAANVEFPSNESFPTNISGVSKPKCGLQPSTEEIKPPKATACSNEEGSWGCGHLLTIYVIPTVLHLAAYGTGFVHFRLRGSEDVYGLMERVFQYCSTASGRCGRQFAIIHRLKVYFAGCILWLVFAFGTRVLYDIAFSIHNTATFVVFKNTTLSLALNYTLFGIDMLGFIVMSTVTMSILFNYIVHCELIIYYIRLIRDKFEMRSISLETAKRDMLSCSDSIHRVNGPIAIMTSLLLLVFGEILALGVSLIFTSNIHGPLMWAYRAAFAIYPMPVFIGPVIQAARVNWHWGKFVKHALSMRTFGYLNATNSELDSFLLFTTSNKPRMKLFRIPVQSSNLMLLVVAGALTFLLLSQAGIIGFNNLV